MSVNAISDEYLCKNNPAFLIGAQAKETPNKIAVIDYIDGKEREFSYQLLEKRILSLTKKLIKIGVKPGCYVAVLSKNRVEMLEIFNAAMRLGATPFGINPGQSSYHIKHILNDSNPKCIFFESSLSQNAVGVIKEYKYSNLISIGQYSTQIETYENCLSEGTSIERKELYDDVPSLITYTSGSTGNPKGVIRRFSISEVLSDAFLSTDIGGIKVYNSLEERKNDPQIIPGPLFHIISFYTLIYLSIGFRVVLMRYFDPIGYIKILAKHKIISSTIGLISPMLTLCIKEKELIEDMDLTNLKYIGIGGAPISSEVIQEAQQLFGCKVIIGYGLSEGFPNLSFTGIDENKIPINCVGKSLNYDEVKLVDTNGVESDFGELWFKSPWLFEGYHNEPKKTAEKFSGDWFKTGDIFFRDKEGFYYFQGRKDDMFICDGENIYPLEVENILCKHEDIQQACVVPLDDPDHGQIPAAMVVCKKNHGISIDELRKFYIKNGPIYAYPRFVRTVDELPTCGPGKVDRIRVKEELKCIYQENFVNSMVNEFTFSKNNEDDVDDFVNDILRKVMKIEKPIDMKENLFNLGISSIQITIIIEKLKEHFEIPLAIEVVYELQTPSEIVKYVKSLIASKDLVNNYQDSMDSEEYII